MARVRVRLCAQVRRHIVEPFEAHGATVEVFVGHYGLDATQLTRLTKPCTPYRLDAHTCGLRYQI